MNKPITKNIIFRITFPIIFGLFAYLIVLMIFDDVQLIINNFFSKEVAFFVLLSFTIFESLLFSFSFIEKRGVFEQKPAIKLSLFIVVSISISVGIVTVFGNVYFRFIENTSISNIELIVFNFIWSFASLLYLSIFYSITFIGKQAKRTMSIEILEKENLDKRLKLLQNKVRPEILYESLEILINLIHKDEKTAEEFISQLSSFYRNIIEERHTETISLDQEIDATENLIFLLNNKYNGKIKLKKLNNDIADFQIIPGIVQQLVFAAVQKNLITEFLPLELQLKIENDYLSLAYACHKRLVVSEGLTETLSEIVDKYKIYSNRKIKEETDENYYKIEIPLLMMETS